MERLDQSEKKILKWIFYCIFKKWFDRGDPFSAKKNSEKAKQLGMSPSFSVNVGEIQFQQCPFTPTPPLR